MPIEYNSNLRSMRWLLERKRNHRVRIPDHQRDFVWTLRQQQRLVESILQNKPIPSLLLRELDDDGLSLEDGQQRLESLRRYVDNEFAVEGVFFRDLSEARQSLFLNYQMIVVSYSGATDEEAREIFNDYQNGKPLTMGERLYSMRLTSPIVNYAIDRLLTPSRGVYDRLLPIMGLDGRTPKGRRGADMATAFALCAGFAFGIDFLSKKWTSAAMILHKEIDAVALDAKIDAYVRVWEEVHRLAPVTNKDRQKDYWDLGNFGGYVAYSILVSNTEHAREYRLPETIQGLVDVWARHITAVYRDEITLEAVLHRNLSSARSWKLARWTNGLRRLFDGRMDVMVDSDDEDTD